MPKWMCIPQDVPIRMCILPDGRIRMLILPDGQIQIRFPTGRRIQKHTPGVLTGQDVLRRIMPAWKLLPAGVPGRILIHRSAQELMQILTAARKPVMIRADAREPVMVFEAVPVLIMRICLRQTGRAIKKAERAGQLQKHP